MEMKIPYVKKIKNNLKSFEIENFYRFTDGNSNTLIDEKGQTTSFEFVEGYRLGPFANIKKIETAGDRVVFYTTTKEIYFSNDAFIKQVKNLKVNTVASCVEILHEGERRLLVITSNSKAYLIEEDGSSYTEYAIPKASVGCVYNRMLFLGNRNQISFSAVDDYIDFTVDFNRGGTFDIDSRDGIIKEFIVYDGKLMIITNNAIYELTANGEHMDYKLKKILNHTLGNVHANTARICAGKLVFLNNYRAYVYDNGQISPIDWVFNEEEYDIKVSVAAYKDTYFVLAQDYSIYKAVLLGYDFKTNQSYKVITPMTNICDGVYAIEANGFFWELTENYFGTTEVSFNSANIDMENPKNKVLHTISLFSDRDGTMSVQTESETRVFSIKKGANVIRMNMSTCAFKLGFSSTQAMTVKKIKIEYRIKEN